MLIRYTAPALVLAFFLLATTAWSAREESSSATAKSCHSSDPSHICLALKYVTYGDSLGTLVVTEEEVEKNIIGINNAWRQCNIAFQLEKFQSVNPVEHRLAYQTTNLAELDDIRNSFGEDSTLLVVTTGTWNRAGTLGNTGANAWTAMPGGGPFGAILERNVAANSNLIAHELGHYLNLSHVNDRKDLMNPVIYFTSTKLDENQCASARSAALSSWQKMLR